MRLDRLVLHGFKSFANNTSFEFPKNFTAIVGPNGSGKSNVSDAIRWVLGEQSMKLLRGKQSQDVIFGGSDELSRLGMALVELHLNNSDGSFPLEYPEVIISRKLFRNGESEYRINNALVRLQDILMMLAKARFGQKSYAVIGQGMITHFLTSSPQERKLFFDEATGVREFQIKRDQAIHKLIRTEENLSQSTAIIAEIEPHLKSLERQVKRREKREHVEIELRAAQEEYYGTLWSQLKQEHFLLKQQFENEAARIEELESAASEYQKASDVMTSEASRNERYEQLQKQFNDLLEEKSQSLKEQAILKGKLEVEHERRGQLSLAWMQRKEDEVSANIHALEEEQSLSEQKIAREEQELTRQLSNLESLKETFRQEEFGILELKERIERESHAMSVPEIQERLRELFQAQEAFLRQILETHSLDQFRTLQKSAKNITHRFALLMDELNSDEREVVHALRVDMKQREEALERLIQEREDAQNKVNELRVSVDAAKHTHTFTHKQLERLQDELAGFQSQITEQGKEETASEQAAFYNKQLSEYEEVLARTEHALQSIRADMQQFNKEEEEKRNQLVALQTQIRNIQRELTNVRQQATTIEVNLARIETRQEDLTEEIQREILETAHEKIFAYTAAPAHTQNELEKKIASYKKQLEAIGSVDDEIVDEFHQTKQRYDFLKEQTDDLNSSIASLETIIDELDETIRKQFQKNFKIINTEFQKYFKVLFEGGSARLELLTETETEEAPQEVEGTPTVEGVEGNAELVEPTPEEQFSLGKKKKRQKIVAGIDIIASPPGKKVQYVNALSGGEKSLVAIALLCAIIAHHPSPFVLLDEVEAALDEENSEKFSAILKDLSKKTQMIIITHNRVTMRAADILYGVTMGKNGASHILSVELKEAEEMVAAE